ncbi:MAG TPA: AAA family ATPase, partial [Methylomirabilota bacterium]|nr:AAA family ATPase [Methylomirabilota bacterium]
MTQIMREKPKMIEWQWPGWVARNTAVTFYGDGGSMKSFILMALAVSIATATPLFQGAPTTGGPVLYLSFSEGPHSENERRLQALVRGSQVEPTDALHYVPADAPMLTPQKFPDLESLVEDYRARVLVIDSLTSNAGLSEGASNDGDAVRALLARTLGLLTEQGVTVYGIAHTPKFQTGTPKPKGSSEWFNGVDAGIAVRAKRVDGHKRALLCHPKGRIGQEERRTLWIEFHDLDGDP